MAELIRGLVTQRAMADEGSREAPHLEDAFARIEGRYSMLLQAAKIRLQREKAAEDKLRKSIRGKPFF